MINPQKGAHLYFLDNLRVLLIILVVVAHIAIPYTGAGLPPYSRFPSSGVLALMLAWFSAVNGAFLIGLFFFISGYFVSTSFDRRGSGVFILDRLVRLGIPLLIYDFIINPVIIYVTAINFEGLNQTFLEFMKEYILNFPGLGNGPVWFVETLLIFSILYAICRTLIGSKGNINLANAKIPGNWSIVIFAIGLWLSSFIVRIWFPVNWANFFNLKLSFMPQYLSFFILGIVAYRADWLIKIPAETGQLWFRIGMITILFFPILIILGRASSEFLGGFNWKSFIYCFWEAIVGASFCVGLPILFREKYNSQGDLSKTLAANTYYVYLIHVPVIFFLAMALVGFRMPNVFRFFILTILGVPLCFLISNFIFRQIPSAMKRL